MLLHSVRSAAFPFFLPLESPHVIFKDSPGRSGFIYLAIQYFLADSDPPCDSFNHTVYHTVLHPLPCLASHLISTTACKTLALPKEGPFNFWDSWSPAELAGGWFWWKNYSNKMSIILFSCSCKYKSEKLVRTGAVTSQCLPVSHLPSGMYSSHRPCCLIFLKHTLGIQQCYLHPRKEE